MYVRTISRHNKDGSTTTYVQLAHNIRDPKNGGANQDRSFGLEAGTMHLGHGPGDVERR